MSKTNITGYANYFEVENPDQSIIRNWPRTSSRVVLINGELIIENSLAPNPILRVKLLKELGTITDADGNVGSFANLIEAAQFIAGIVHEPAESGPCCDFPIFESSAVDRLHVVPIGYPSLTLVQGSFILPASTLIKAIYYPTGDPAPTAYRISYNGGGWIGPESDPRDVILPLGCGELGIITIEIEVTNGVDTVTVEIISQVGESDDFCNT